MTRREFYLADAAAQEALAGRLARHCPAGMVIYLQGELGTGKTTFVRGFLQALGHQGVVKSPTYTLVEPYRLQDRPYYHFDLYRLADPEELEYAGGRDYFGGDAVCLVEWPEKAAGYLPQADLVCEIQYAEAGRRLSVQARTPRGRRMMQDIAE